MDEPAGSCSGIVTKAKLRFYSYILFVRTPPFAFLFQIIPSSCQSQERLLSSIFQYEKK